MAGRVAEFKKARRDRDPSWSGEKVGRASAGGSLAPSGRGAEIRMPETR